MKSLINRRAAKAADSMHRRSGMFSTGGSIHESVVRPETRNREQRQKPEKSVAKSAASKTAQDACPGYIEEKDMCYPLCDNPKCPRQYGCGLSAHMVGPYDEM